jgi:hypothetical protein
MQETDDVSVPFWGSKKFFRNYQLPILLNFLANIAWLPLFEQQTAGFLPFWLFYFPLYKHVRIFFLKNRQYFRKLYFFRA